MGFSQHSVCVSVGVHVCAWCVCVYQYVCKRGIPAHYMYTICTLYAQGMSEVKQLSQNINHCGMHYTCDHEATSPSRVTVPP